MAVTKQVNKYPIPGTTGTLNVNDVYSVVFCAFENDGKLHLWIEVENGSAPHQIEYAIIDTGAQFDSAKNWQHVRAFMDADNKVGHVYIRDK